MSKAVVTVTVLAAEGLAGQERRDTRALASNLAVPDRRRFGVSTVHLPQVQASGR
ncbi:hypothetical protein [Candidatus Palauibacter sp.]|uniref:hypothetical protein n=1 Tax=Candidatus Palauibacter sp. TaxID=3101350 RepID=UPI003B5AD0A7